MKKTMKKIALFLVLILILQALCACQATTPHEDGTSPTDGTTVDSETTLSAEQQEEIYKLLRKVAADWSVYVTIISDAHEALIWATTYINAFAEDPTWQKLETARYALHSAEGHIAAYKADEYMVSSEQYTYLINHGYELVGLSNTLNSYETDRNSLLSSCANLSSMLYLNVYSKQELSFVKRYVEVIQKNARANVKHLAYMTDYLMTTLANDIITADFTTYMNTNFPNIMAYLGEFSGDAAWAITSVDSCIDEIDGYTTQLEVLVGEYQVIIDNFNNMDAAARKQNRVDIKDIPFMIPASDWLLATTSQFTYYYVSEGGEVALPKPGDEITVGVNRCMAVFSGVSEQTFKDYIVSLDKLGFEAFKASEDNGIHTWMFMLDGCSFSLSYGEDEMTVVVMNSSFPFFPAWYIEACN